MTDKDAEEPQATNESTELNSLKYKREQIKDRLTRIKTFLDNFEIGQNINSVKARQETAHGTLEEFDNVTAEIEERVPLADLKAEGAERIAFEDRYYETITKIKSLIEQDENTKSVKSNQATVVNVANKPKITLPTIKIPEFNGSYDKWLAFRDMFTSLIHDNPDLTDIEKLHYLKSAVSGEALRTIESLAISNSNYDAAWKLLVQRFENTRLIVQAHIRKIINSPAITKATSNTLRQLIDDVRTNLESLNVLKQPVTEWDSILVTIIADKLDFHSNREWQSKLSHEVPTLSDLLKFLENRCQYFESATYSNNSKSQTKTTNKAQSCANLASKKHNCLLCKKNNHYLHQCNNFLKLSVNDRLEQVKQLKLCSNCLRNNHEVAQCKSDKTCRDCKSKHNTLLHVNRAKTTNEISSDSPSNSNASHCNNHKNEYSENLLSTAIVLIKDINGEFHDCRVLLDGGSQSNFITKDLCKKLNLKIKTVQHQITGINAHQSSINEMVDVTIKSNYSTYTAKISCLVLTKITGQLPLVSFPSESLKIPDNISLADKDFFISRPIDLLLGAQLFLELLKIGKIQLSPKRLYLQNTHLGWAVGGNINFNSSMTSICYHATSVGELELNKRLEKFWEVESYGYDSNKIYTKEEIAAEQHFKNTTKREPDGRFIVNFPKRDDNIQLGNSFHMAKQRFNNLERKLTRTTQLKFDYQRFMAEYRELGHMELVPDNQIDKPDVYYLPHHAVYKNEKIRVVFDASAKSTNNKSLNDNLLTGPNIQQDLVSILTRFRTFQYIISSDIVKMYRQIKMDESDRDYQRIIWRDNSNEPIEIYRLTTVTYGTASAPFLALRCLHQLAQDYGHLHPVAANAILKGFYMDDLLYGGNCIKEVTTMRDQLIHVLNSGGFKLSKWASNETSLLPDINTKSGDTSITLNFDNQGETKTLGLIWNCKRDILKYKVEQISVPTNITKRNILSTICRISDPLGLINPVLVKAKILLQQLWARKTEWDKPVPADIATVWTQLVVELQVLNEIKIPRNVVLKGAVFVELHGFCDASEKAYGAAIYLKTTNQKGQVNIQLLIAKSRVAPLKSTTIPRLELLAAQLLARLSDRVVHTLELLINKTYFWSDLTIVLAWLSQPSLHWQTFVANRVSDIQNLTEINDWHHIDTADNPADLISRGVFPNHLLKSELWWRGPDWLSKTPDSWPNANKQKEFNIIQMNIPEKRTNTIVAVSALPTLDLEILTKISNFTRLKRIIAYVHRFIHNCKYRNNKERSEVLTSAELNRANNTIIKLVQSQTFAQEIRDLKINGKVHRNSPLTCLNPFLDTDGIIRVGGRLRHANLSFDQKHPMIIPKTHHVTDLIIRHFHQEHLHAGAQTTLAAIRQQYWPIHGRSKIKQVLHKCIRCFRANPKVTEQQMGDLPSVRIEPARAFIRTGIDYCGPILIKENSGRGRQTTKAYICLFICLCTKAIHLELVSNLSTDTFLSALRRFISRRGHVNYLLSDNATNFVGGNKVLKELSDFFKEPKFQDTIISTLANEGIDWSFIPPRSPNFGGLWESSVKLVKHHLKRVIGETKLTFEEMYTLLTQIEAILNSRPLTPLSNDPNDLIALTPGHFLIGEVLTAPLEHDITPLKTNRLSRWQLVEQIRQHFWKRWRLEYVSQLQQRKKWKSTTTPIQPGALVLILEENVPPLCWPLGRIQQTYPGKDGVVRVVSVKTNKGTYKRGISKICVLPMDEQVV